MGPAFLLAACRAVLGLAFAVSFAAKARSPTQFAQTISSFRLLPKPLVKYAAVLLVSGEAGVVLLMVLGNQFLPAGFGLSVLLLTVFTLAILSALARNLRISCNCFGPANKPISRLDVARDVGLLGCALIGWWTYLRVRGGLGSDNWLVSVGAWLEAASQADIITLILAISAVLTWSMLLFLVLFVLLLAKRINQLSQHAPKEQLLKEALARRGHPAPPFTAHDLAGSTVTLDTYRGRAIAFVFLSPSCKPCVDRMQGLKEFAGHANGMEIVLVNVDPHFSTATFVAEHAVQYPVLSAPQPTNRFSIDYGASSTPSFCLVGKDQRIRAAGHLDSHYWQEQLALMWS